TLPEGFPQLRTQQYTIPLIYFSSGSLDLQPDKGVFKPASGESGHNSQGVSYINLLENMCFDINYNSIISIELYRHQKYSIKVLNIQWIRILTKDSVLDGDILLCVGGSVSSGKADETTTRQLYEKLIDLTIDTVK
ncbi:MAG: hypothetical protein Q8930_08040, partial [Bacillota bacterium]|nr:hypothetical protein [Bacillota bacterium]